MKLDKLFAEGGIAFKKKTGNTINEYATFVRLKLAKEMLISGKSISEIATACGFVNAGNFTRLFRKYFDTFPKDYRKTFHLKVYAR